MLDLKMVGAWRPASSLLHAASTGMTKAMDKAVLQIAHELRAEVLLGFRTQAPAGRRGSRCRLGRWLVGVRLGTEAQRLASLQGQRYATS